MSGKLLRFVPQAALRDWDRESLIQFQEETAMSDQAFAWFVGIAIGTLRKIKHGDRGVGHTTAERLDNAYRSWARDGVNAIRRAARA